MTKSEKIQELSEIWGGCIVGHHKSSDCNHYVTTKYCFGGIEFLVEHGAYIGHDIQKTFNTLEAAQNYLIQELECQIQEQIDFNILRFNNSGDEPEMTLEYWRDLQVKLEKIKLLSIDNLPEKLDEEDYWSTKKDLERMNYHYKLVEEILDKEQVPIKDTEHDMEYSLNYRVELLVKKLKNKNNDNIFLADEFDIVNSH